MSATYELFTRWKAAKKIKSDNAGAIALGETRQTVSNWKERGNGSVSVIERMASDLGEDAMLTIIAAFKESGTAEDRKAWTRIGKRFGAVALAVLMLSTTAYNVRAEGCSIEQEKVSRPSIHYE